MEMYAIIQKTFGKLIGRSLHLLGKVEINLNFQHGIKSIYKHKLSTFVRLGRF